MNSENLIKNLRILWRTDRIIADIRLRHLLVGMGMRALPALIAAFGLLMLELASYFALVQIWSAILAATILGGINFVFAAILFMIALRSPTSRELDFATEIHGSAIEALQADVRGLRSQASNLVHHPLSGVIPLLVPLVITSIQSLTKSNSGKSSAPSVMQSAARVDLMGRKSIKREDYGHASQADPEYVFAAAVPADSP